MEFRQYRGYDQGLKTGPYTFGNFFTRPNWATHYPYQQGLLITYWDLGFSENNVSAHRGEGRSLPIAVGRYLRVCARVCGTADPGSFAQRLVHGTSA